MRSENSKSVNESSGGHENENIEEHLSSKEDDERFEVANENDDQNDENNTVKTLSVVEEENKSNASNHEQENSNTNEKNNTNVPTVKKETVSCSEHLRKKETVSIYQMLTNYIG